MDVQTTAIAGMLVIEPTIHSDNRGTFAETWQERRYAEHGIQARFVQDNLARSVRGVLRGLHFQSPHAQAKLVQAIDGKVFDVVVDIRAGSPTFGQAAWLELDGDRGTQVFVPAGCAHGYQVLSESAVVAYKVTEVYHPASDRCIRWDDPSLAIPWPMAPPVLSAKDAAAPLLAEVAPELLCPGARQSCPADARIVTADELLAQLTPRRRAGETVVFTNGCFDILHLGHARYLAEARTLGDILVVGLNSDRSVAELKGPTRPLIPEHERAEVLAHLAAVDYVCIFDDLRPHDLIEQLRPDIHVKGGDYRVEDLPETPIVRGVGGEVRVLSLTKGLSTTAIIERAVATHG